MYVSNTDANNMDRFEGFCTPNLRGELHSARITILSGSRHRLAAQPESAHRLLRGRAAAVGERREPGHSHRPRGLDRRRHDLRRGASARARSAVIDTAELALPPGAPGAFAPDARDHVARDGRRPGRRRARPANTRLYVYTRFDNGVSVIDTGARAEIAHLRVHTPEPAEITDGRPILYDTSFTSANGEASCAVCHVFGDFDSLTWDLGDPDGTRAEQHEPVREPDGQQLSGSSHRPT